MYMVFINSTYYELLVDTGTELHKHIGVVQGDSRTTPSLRVVCDVHDCFVDRYKKKTAPSKGPSTSAEQVVV